MKLEKANGTAMSKLLHKLKQNENNIGVILPDIGQHLKNSDVPNTIADAIRWADIMLGKSSKIEPIDCERNTTSLSIKSIQPLKNASLTTYLKRRKISLSIVDEYVEQAWIFNHKTQKSFVALAYKNESGGYEIVNHNISATKYKRDITVIRGKKYKPKGVHIFKNILDFLSLLSYRQVTNLDEDSIILNCWSNLSKATPYIKGYGYKFVCCWFEHTQIGIAATKSVSNFIKTEIGTRFINMVNVYKEHVSLYNWHLNYSDNPSS